MQRRLVVVGAIAFVFALTLAIVAGCGGKRDQNQVVARVNGKDITRAEVVKVLEQQDNGSALDSLIARQLIRQKAQERGIKVSEDEINRRINSMSDYVLAESGQNLDQYLVEHGQTRDDLKEAVSLQILTTKLIIPDSEKKKFFEENKARLADFPQNAESVIYRRIVLGTKPEAESVRKQLAGKGDTEFAKVASEKSLDPMTRTRGGMAGWIVKGKGVTEDKDVEKALFTPEKGKSQPEPGQLSEPLPFASTSGSSGQWQLVEVVKYFPPHQMRLEDNEDQIESALLSPPQGGQPVNAALYMEAQQFFTGLQNSANIEIVSPRYKALGERYKQQKEAAEKMKSMGMGMPGAPGGAPGGAPSAPAGGQPAPAGK